MFKKKWLLLGGVVVLFLAISITAVSGNSLSNLFNFKKVDGIKQVQEGVIVDLPTRKDKLEVVNSIDQITAAPTLNLKATAEDKTVYTKHFVAEDTGKEIYIPYVKEQTKDVIIYDPVTTLTSVPIPETDEYLISFDGTIYKTDWENSKLTKFLKDEVNGYEKDVVLSYNGTPIWGTNPIVNPTGTYMLFFSERSVVRGNMNGGMWIKNIKTGDETPTLFEGSGSVVGWMNDTELVFDGIEIVLIDLETGDIQKLVENGAKNVALVKDQLVYQDAPGSLILQSVITGEKTTISSSLINWIGSYQTRGSWIALVNIVRDEDRERSVVLYNIDSKNWKVITSPTNTWIDGAFWADDSTLHIWTSKKGRMDEATYIVNIDEVEVVQ